MQATINYYYFTIKIIIKCAWSQVKSDCSEIACLTDFIIRVFKGWFWGENMKRKTHIPIERSPKTTKSTCTNKGRNVRSKMIFESSFNLHEQKVKAEINLSVWSRTTWSSIILEFAAAGQSHWPESPPSLSSYLSHNQDLKLTSTKIFYKWYGIGYNNLHLLACVPSKYSVQ